MFNEENVKGVFFVDVCSAIVHQQKGLFNFSQPFLEQIQSLVHDGHDVQLHIHPSWYMTQRQGYKLIPSHTGYRLHEYGFEGTKTQAIDIISESVEYLNSNLSCINGDYRCIAYRTGGFSIQPEEILLKTLRDKGIVIDSSVVPFMKNDRVNGFDFSDVPNKLNWWIDPKQG